MSPKSQTLASIQRELLEQGNAFRNAYGTPTALEVIEKLRETLSGCHDLAQQRNFLSFVCLVEAWLNNLVNGEVFTLKQIDVLRKAFWEIEHRPKVHGQLLNKIYKSFQEEQMSSMPCIIEAEEEESFG